MKKLSPVLLLACLVLFGCASTVPTIPEPHFVSVDYQLGHCDNEALAALDLDAFKTGAARRELAMPFDRAWDGALLHLMQCGVVGSVDRDLGLIVCVRGFSASRNTPGILECKSALPLVTLIESDESGEAVFLYAGWPRELLESMSEGLPGRLVVPERDSRQEAFQDELIAGVLGPAAWRFQ